MTIKKIGNGAKYCVTSDFGEFDELLQVTVDFAGNSFWGKHVAHEGDSTRKMARGRQVVTNLDDLEDLDEIEGQEVPRRTPRLLMDSSGRASTHPLGALVPSGPARDGPSRRSAGIVVA